MFLIMVYSVLGSISEFSTSFEIDNGNVHVIKKIEFSEPMYEFSIKVPASADNIEVYADESKVEFLTEDNNILLELEGASTITIKYYDDDLLESSGFLTEFVLQFNTELNRIELSLPKGYTLREPLNKDMTEGSIYPKPDLALTDGEHLIFVWEYNNLSEGYELPIYVKYNKPKNNIWLLLVFGTIISGILILILITKKPINKYSLKEDEQAIVNILKKRDGRMCEQGTLRVITGLPKASLSRLLKELEERKVIYKEKKGRKNFVFLR